MDKRLFCLAVTVLALTALVSQAIAEVPAGARFKHADKNKDGVVDRKEIRMEKQWEQEKRARVTSWWERRADTNNDGAVDSNELAAWKQLSKDRLDLNNDGTIDAKERRLCWRHRRARVNNEVEKKYDANADGWLEPAEVKELLKDRYALIKTNGKAKVDTAVEEDYDANDDGVLDAQEAEAMKEDAS